ncbi:uncharacterized protein LOC108673117 isoform X2 [Hyalella azteca]|nr:uncharacterized protein LOC108673117 isoform X2 [Hyalella azteca]
MSSSDNIKLILAVKKHPAVWDTACSDYTDKIEKVNAWKTICKEVTVNYAEIKDDEAKNNVAKQLQTKWKTLRDAFRKNQNLIRNTPSGSGTNKHVRPYLYAPQMQFLLKTFDAAENASNNPTPTNNNQDETKVQLSSKIDRKPKKSRPMDMQIPDYLKKPDDSGSDEIGLFFRSLKSFVKDFTKEETLELKARVISIISDIRKFRNNYPRNNVAGTSEASTFYTYNNNMSTKEPLVWTHSLVERLIDLYRDHECLWRVTSKKYKNRIAKEKAMVKIVGVLRNFCAQVTVAEVRKKIHTLRSQFHREMKLIRESTESGAGADQMYTPKLWCFESLMFINDIDAHRQSTSTLDEDVQVSNDGTEGDQDQTIPHEEYFDDTFTEATTPSTPSSPSRSNTPSLPESLQSTATALPSTTSSEALILTPMQKTSNLTQKKRKIDPTDELIQVALSKLTEKKNDDDDLSAFGVVVATQIRNMNKTQATISRKLINDALFMGSMNMLETNSRIVTASNCTDNMNF